MGCTSLGRILEINMDLTIEELKEKIIQVEKDIQHLIHTGETGRKFEVLSQYKSYLEEELQFIKNNS